MGNHSGGTQRGAYAARAKARAASTQAQAQAKSTVKPSKAPVTLEPAVAARQAALDSQYGAYSRAALRAQMKLLIRQYPELENALEYHVMGKDARRNPQLSPDSIARARPYVEVRGRYPSQTTYRAVKIEGDRQQRGQAAFAKVRELSEWSLLHSPKLNADGTLTLYHGSQGRVTQANRVARYAQGTYRQGTSFTDSLKIARVFANSTGRKGVEQIIRADVPVSSISSWHALFPASGAASSQHEFVVDSGRLRRVSQINLDPNAPKVGRPSRVAGKDSIERLTVDSARVGSAKRAAQRAAQATA
jgi:hypothetical protein